MLNAVELTSHCTTESRNWSARLPKPEVAWTAQGGLAALFLFAGVFKLFASAETLADAGLPVTFMRFIGVCETLGGLGLVLPGVTNIKRGLTPIAAAGLVIIMIGAVCVTVAQGGGVAAGMPLIVGIAAAYVVITRRSWFTGK